MNNIVIDVELNEKDIIEFQKAHYSKLISPVMRYTIIAIVGLLFIANVAIDIISGTYFSITAVLLGIILAILLLMPVMFYFSAKKTLKSNKMLRATQTYTFNAETVSSVSEFNDMNSRWDLMHEFHESKNNFLFYIGHNQAFLVPKHCFNGDEEKMAAIREWTKAVPEKKKKMGLFKISIAVSIGLAAIMFIILMILTLNQ